MGKQFLFLYIMLLLSAVFCSLSVCFFIRTKNKRANCTEKTTGTVIRYSQSDNGVCLPVAEYFVDGKRYTGKRKWRFCKTVQAPWIKQSSAEIDSEKDSLTIRGNSFLFLDPICKLYPVGMQLNVFYNPEKPRQSYVEVIDQRASVLGKVMLFTGIGIAALGLAIFLLITFL